MPIAKQLSGLNPLSLGNNKNYRLEKWRFAFVINIKYLLNPQYTNFQLSQKTYWENFKIIDYKYRSWILKNIVFLADMVTWSKQPLSKFVPRKPWTYKQLWGLRRGPSYL